MTPSEIIIEHILAQHAELSKEEIIEKLNQEKNRTGGLISDETLLRVIAAQEGVSVPGTDLIGVEMLSSKDLIPGLNNITVEGRVIGVFPAKSFNNRKSGKVASFLVCDDTGILRIVLWNDKTDLIEAAEIKPGQIVRISHGYTKEGRSSDVELHVSKRSEVETNPKNTCNRQYPDAKKHLVRISEAASLNGKATINVAGTVSQVFATSAFTRQDLSMGKVKRFSLRDETGEIQVAAWNEQVDQLEASLKQGMGLLLINARMRQSVNGEVELHIDSGTYSEALMNP